MTTPREALRRAAEKWKDEDRFMQIPAWAAANGVLGLLDEVERLEGNQRTKGAMEVCALCSLFCISLDRDNDSTNWSTCENPECPINAK